MSALALALTWLTVLPVRTGAPSERTAAGALRWAPPVGAALGAVAGLVVWGLTALGVPGLVAGLLAVGVLALGTRGMHVDGLADTADGLGCFGPPERALAVMKDGGAGPFAVVTLLVVLGAQAGSLAALSGWQVVAGAAVAVASGRAGFCWVARRGVPAARPGGLGAMVAESQPAWVAPLWWVVLAPAGYAVAGWRGPAGVALAAVLVVALSAHTARRFGGMSGDVLGAAAELGTAAALLLLAA
ncbi:adenosylcobinamide-GDP ribazoletransferase [Pseudonocardia kujensis]|uniref:adenosylcobinamide-GDP ribazoletransferase n=1 Tax=Pseudonocardia kujensis TaxID=1128675 RepID=UPI001E3C78A5|nr:adenosylcobinamide-GDP ribazoletransferase [Pseudonocardia kujensis]MCE0766555.1 adenosylcobinamide-GDP ribazoletransferase [Pseudonocardia kujensis]